LRNLVEGDLDQRRIADVQAQEERRRRVLAGDRHHAMLELGSGHRPAGDEDRAIALPHRRTGIHHAVAVGDEQVGRKGHRGHLELGGARAAIQRLDVLEHMLDGHPGNLHLPGRERIKHERVVRVGAVTDPHRGHRRLLDRVVPWHALLRL